MLALRRAGEIPLRLLPGSIGRGDPSGQVFEPGVRVEQLTLAGSLEQRLVGVLAVDVDQQTTENLQVLQRHRLAVDERA